MSGDGDEVQTAHKSKPRPSRHGVVADKQNPANLQLAAQEANNHSTVVVQDPAPDTVQGNEVKLRQFFSDTERIKDLIKELRTIAAVHYQFLRKARLRRIEIRTMPRRHRGRSVDIR